MSDDSEEELAKKNNEYCEQSDWDSGSDSEFALTQYEGIDLKEQKAFDLYKQQLEVDGKSLDSSNWRNQMTNRILKEKKEEEARKKGLQVEGVQSEVAQKVGNFVLNKVKTKLKRA